jgi:uncharacterized protein YeaO (DUF488 family)
MILVKHVLDRMPKRGKRFLVERLWPKAVTRDDLDLAAWCKGAAPAHNLLRWYDNKLERWMEFRDDYRQQLADSVRSLQPILDAIDEGEDVILLHAADDNDYCAAQVLAEFLSERLG